MISNQNNNQQKVYYNGKKRKESNHYGLKFEEVSEEEIIRGAIESDIPVFLHGPSSSNFNP